MLALIQRVSEARVSVAGEVIGEIGPGLLALLGVQKADTPAEVDRLLAKLLGYRVFADERGAMNLSLRDTGGELLLVSQFTLAADTSKGLRPSFSSAAPPEIAETLYDLFVAKARQEVSVATGQFGASMKVSLVNDGPVTFMLQV